MGLCSVLYREGKYSDVITSLFLATELGFDEPNPYISNLVSLASPASLAYLFFFFFWLYPAFFNSLADDFLLDLAWNFFIMREFHEKGSPAPGN